ncbi:MAG TPA: adventurous gliding motility protein CglE [Anaeromyxobacter sp.]|nr:adventurous gliding motility protein CglE [Anaeromyxobacter sp.]
MKRILRIVVAAELALAASPRAVAQDAAPPLQENPHAAHFNDVERGTYLAFDAGYLGFLKTPTQDPAQYPYAGSSGGNAGGMLLALSIGRDLSSRFALALVLQGGNERASVSYGAFSLYSGGLDVRYAYYGSRDRNDWERFFLYLHARGTYGVSYPKGLFATHEFIAQAGPGLEYYTRLRHFSVGAAVDYVYAAEAKASGFAIYPTLRYTF